MNEKDQENNGGPLNKTRSLRSSVSILMVMFLLIFAFQNCQKAKNLKPQEGVGVHPSSPTSSTATLMTHIGDKATFEISEEHTGGKTISHILWQATRGSDSCDANDVIVATGTDSNIEIDWSSFLERSVSVKAFIQFEEDDCITYRQQRVMVSKAGASGSLCSNNMYRFDIVSQLSSDDATESKRYFPVESSVDLELKISGPNDPDFDAFAWSIKRLFLEDDTQRADSNNQTKTLTHNFSEIGLYNIIAEAFKTTSTTTTQNNNSQSGSTSTQLLIGKCEGDDLSDIEIVLSNDSFGPETPKGVLGPIWNYVRPADTDPGVHVATLNVEGHPFGRHIYKYPRQSRSKFIDIDIQNVDTCFLDQEPISNQMCTKIGCPESDPDCNSCWTEYEIREDVSALPSCRGNALDMSALDLDTTECTDAVFAIAVSKTIDVNDLPKAPPQTNSANPSSEGSAPIQPTEPVSSAAVANQNIVSSVTGNGNSKGDWRNWWGATPRAFYKHCPADSDYCYFGLEAYRPEEHHCDDGE